MLIIHIYFVYWHVYMKINIINFDNLDKYQRLIKTLSTLSMKTRLCLKGTFTLSVDLLWFALICFDLQFKNWTILRIISKSSNNLNLNRGCVCFTYQIFVVTVGLIIYHWSKCITAYFNEILFNFFIGAMVFKNHFCTCFLLKIHVY